MTTLEVLRRARALLEKEEAWGKMPAIKETDQLCAVLACHRAGGGSVNQIVKDAWWSLNLQISDPERDRFLSVGKWNDAPERTHAEVMELFDKAIREEEKRENS